MTDKYADVGAHGAVRRAVDSGTPPAKGVLKACEWCGELFVVRRFGAKFCWQTSRCRTAASRAAKRARDAQPAEAVQAPVAENKMAALRAAVERVTSRKKGEEKR